MAVGLAPQLSVLCSRPQKLESSVLTSGEGKSLIIRGGSEDAPPTRLPARIREIVAKNLSALASPAACPGEMSLLSLQEENRILQQELSRVEDLLAQSRAERDELAIKYNAISERVERASKLQPRQLAVQTPSGSAGQGLHVRSGLQGRGCMYVRALKPYMEGGSVQQPSGELTLPEVTEESKSCSWAQGSHQMTGGGALTERERDSRGRTRPLLDLAEDSQLSSSLAQVNAMLREQLDQANTANQALSEDIRKLTADWTKARDELEQREGEGLCWAQTPSGHLGGSPADDRAGGSWRGQGPRKRPSLCPRSRDLSELNNELSRCSRTIHASCLNLSSNLRLSESSAGAALEKQALLLAQLEEQLKDKVRDMIQLQVRCDLEKAELGTRIAEMTATLDLLKAQNSEKEKTIETLTQKLENLEATRAQEQAVLEAEEIEALRTELEMLQQTLRDLAQAVLSDADSAIHLTGTERMMEVSESDVTGFSLRGLSSSLRTPSPLRRTSPRRSSSPRRSLSPAFSDSTLAMVHSALQKRQLQLQDVRGKYEATQELVSSLRKQLSESDAERRSLEQTILQLKDNVDRSLRARDDAVREASRFRASADLLGSEKSNLERSLQALQQHVETLRQESERLQLANSDLQRQRDHLEDEKEDMAKDTERAQKEIERGHKQQEQLELKKSSLKKELILVKEALHKATLEKEVSENEKVEMAEALGKESRAELELAANKLKAEEASLRDSLSKMSSLNEGLAQDKIELNRIISQLEEEKVALLGQKQEVEQEKASIRDELVRLEQEKLELDTERQGLERSLQDVERSRERLERELLALQKERVQLQEQGGQRSRVGEGEAGRGCWEPGSVGQRSRVEMGSLVVSRLGVLGASSAGQRSRVGEGQQAGGAGSQQRRSEKDALETSLFDLQQQLAQLDARKEQLEAESQNLLLAKETMQSEKDALETSLFDLQQQLAQLDARKEQLEAESQNLLLAKETMQGTWLPHPLPSSHPPWAERRPAAPSGMAGLREKESGPVARRQAEKLLLFPPTPQQPRAPAPVCICGHATQALSLKESEKTLLSEKLTGAQHNLASVTMELERQKREAMSRQEQDRSTINALTSELKGLGAQLEEAVAAHEREARGLQEQAKDLTRQRESTVREVSTGLGWGMEGLQGQERVTGVTVSRHKMGHAPAEGGAAQRRQIPACSERPGGQCCPVSAPSAGAAARASPALFWCPQIKMLDSENTKKSKEVAELQARVALDEQREEESRRESLGLRQKIVESEASRESARKELPLQGLAVLGSAHMARLCGAEVALLKAVGGCEGQKGPLCPVRGIRGGGGRAEAAELSLRLSAAEGRTHGLEAELARVEGLKRDVEFKLGSLHSALRRTMGISRGGRAPSPAIRGRSSSPKRFFSPPKGKGPGEPWGSPESKTCLVGSASPERSPSSRPLSPELVADIDPDVVRTALRDFLQELRETQRERGDLRAQLGSLTRQLAELEAERDSASTRVQQLQKLVAESEEGRRSADGKLSSAQTALLLQEEALRRSERERKALMDKVAGLERSLQSADGDRRVTQENLLSKKRKKNRTGVVGDRRCLAQSLSRVSQSTRVFSESRRNMTSQVSPDHYGLAEQTGQTQGLSRPDRHSHLAAQVADSETKASALQLSVERLHLTLAKAEEGESALKDKVQGLCLSLSEINASAGTTQEKVLQLQKALMAGEHDRRVLQVGVAWVRAGVSHQPFHGASQGAGRIAAPYLLLLPSPTTEQEAPVQASPPLLRQCQESEGAALRSLQKLQDDKRLLQERLGSLQRALAQLESEKRAAERSSLRLGKDNVALKKTLDKVSSQPPPPSGSAPRLSPTLRRCQDMAMGSPACPSVCRKETRGLGVSVTVVESWGAGGLKIAASQQPAELQLEIERLRGSQIQAERTLEARERAHRQRVKGLEEQILTLKEQLQQELRKYQPHYSHSSLLSGN
uniref:Ciliary rootlet coiled-coil, rootletin n=1 Tax=Pelodiscus sinensis TaxID=13735 RepID=K7FYX7_PELSI